MTETQTTNLEDYKRQVKEWGDGVIAFYEQILDLMPEEVRRKLLELKRTEAELEKICYEMLMINQSGYEIEFKLADGRGRLVRSGAYDGYRYLADRAETAEEVGKRLRELSDKILPNEYLEPRE